MGAAPASKLKVAPVFLMGPVKSSGQVKQSLCLAFEGETIVLMGFAPRDGGNALHEIEYGLGFAIFLEEHGVDDLGRVRFGEAALL